VPKHLIAQQGLEALLNERVFMAQLNKAGDRFLVLLKHAFQTYDNPA